MAIMRIAFAAVALFYIAPHLGGQMIEKTRPLVDSAKTDLSVEAISEAALHYCQNNPETCARIARSALAANAAPPVAEIPVQAALRLGQASSLLPEKTPLPPKRPPELRPALKP